MTTNRFLVLDRREQRRVALMEKKRKAALDAARVRAQEEAEDSVIPLRKRNRMKEAF